MKPRHAAALALVGWCLSGCQLIPHRELSPRVTGKVLDQNSQRPVSGASVTMDGFFTASGSTGADGQFELPRKKEWMSYVALGDPGCDVLIRAPGYEDWREMFLCGLADYGWDFGNILLKTETKHVSTAD
jgi:hypothetical protein